MKWIRYTQASRTGHGILKSGGRQDHRGAWRSASGYEKTGETVRLDDVRIEVPVVPPLRGLNYVTHIGTED